MTLMTLKIRGRDNKPFALARHAKIELDGTDISSFLTGFKIEGQMNGINQITLYCAGFVDLPEELQGQVMVEQNDDACRQHYHCLCKLM